MSNEPGQYDNSVTTGGQSSSSHNVWRGIGLALLLHLIQVPLAFLTSGISLIFLGVSQLVYIIPAIVVYKRNDRSEIVKGLIIAAAITFLLNATCTVLFFASIHW